MFGVFGALPVRVRRMVVATVAMASAMTFAGAGVAAGSVAITPRAVNPIAVPAVKGSSWTGSPEHAALVPSLTAPRAIAFTYDYADRLSQAWTPSSGSCPPAASSTALSGPAPYWQSYSDDDAGDRTAAVQHAVGAGAATTSTYAYATAGQARPDAVDTVTSTGATTGTATYGYDAEGHTISRPGQTLTNDAEGRLSTVTAGTNTENDVYTADGDLLLRMDSTGETLYFSDPSGSTEVHQAVGATNASASRTYLFAGQPVAVRTAAAGSTTSTTSTVSWLVSDNHSSTLTAINSTTGTVTRRYLDPFGNTRGASAAWPDDRSFLDDPTDPATSTEQVGARVYDPTLGRFLTVDPVLERNDPQALNGYAYADNDPAQTETSSSAVHSCARADTVPTHRPVP